MPSNRCPDRVISDWEHTGARSSRSDHIAQFGTGPTPGRRKSIQVVVFKKQFG